MIIFQTGGEASTTKVTVEDAATGPFSVWEYHAEIDWEYEERFQKAQDVIEHLGFLTEEEKAQLSKYDSYDKPY
jgi:hypothetical protein